MNGADAFGLFASCHDFADGRGLAKRMECVQLAGAVVLPWAIKSGSKLQALHTLREVRLGLRGAAHRLQYVCLMFSLLIPSPANAIDGPLTPEQSLLYLRTEPGLK